MDIISHGLWGSLAFGRKSRKNFWLAFFIGVAPDLLSFGILTGVTFLGFSDHPDWSSGQHPDPSQIPLYVHHLYDVTHSLVIFSVVFGLVWLLRKKPLYLLAPWALHILVDIPTHSNRFFPTPFLWPISDFTVNGIPWSSPFIFFPNVLLLIILYVTFFMIKKRSKKTSQASGT